MGGPAHRGLSPPTVGWARPPWAEPSHTNCQLRKLTGFPTDQSSGGIFFSKWDSFIPNDWSLCSFGHKNYPVQLAGRLVSSKIHPCPLPYAAVPGFLHGSRGPNSCRHARTARTARTAQYTVSATVPPQPPAVHCWKHIRPTICFSLSSLFFKFSTLFEFYRILKIIFKVIVTFYSWGISINFFFFCIKRGKMIWRKLVWKYQCSCSSRIAKLIREAPNSLSLTANEPSTCRFPWSFSP